MLIRKRHSADFNSLYFFAAIFDFDFNALLHFEHKLVRSFHLQLV